MLRSFAEQAQMLNFSLRLQISNAVSRQLNQDKHYRYPVKQARILSSTQIDKKCPRGGGEREPGLSGNWHSS